MSLTLNDVVKTLPPNPGVYRYYDQANKLLYVGKAKNLKKRVASYFSNKKHENAKTKLLVKKIDRIEFTIVQTEHDALFLENSLIKEFKPKFNIQLKDDKTYPWICVKKEPFPRIFPTRNVIKDGSKYFGPYASVKIMNTLLDLIKQVYPLRNCKYHLSQENVEENKFKVCLEYHIGNCKGPCIDYGLKGEYDANIDQIEKIIKGDIRQVLKTMSKKMEFFAKSMDFEAAQSLKDKLALLGHYQAKSTVVSSTISNVDVYGFSQDKDNAFVNFMHVVNGAIVNTHTLTIKKSLNEDASSLLGIGIAELSKKFGTQSKNVLVPFLPDFIDDELNYLIPKRGDKKKLLELSDRNARFFQMDFNKKLLITDPNKSVNRILETIKKDFRLKKLPTHIECFDNSNIQGTNAVAACVVFKNGKPSKKDYRHFNIKTVEGPDDFASMEEVVFRRYKRLLMEKADLPQLIVIDGGKGQLSSAVKSLRKLDLIGKVAIVGIAKKLEEIFFPGDTLPLYIDKRSESLKVIQHLRNEAHRFGIEHHRNKRSKGAITSDLDNINGIGTKTKEKLMNHFKSLKRIKSANLAELEAVVGPSIAKKIADYFKLK